MNEQEGKKNKCLNDFISIWIKMKFKSMLKLISLVASTYKFGKFISSGGFCACFVPSCKQMCMEKTSCGNSS